VLEPKPEHESAGVDQMFAPAEGAQLYCEIAGAGEPVLLIMGLGLAATAWWRTVPVLAQRFRVISFDNRGSGRSDCPRGPYTLAQLADDGLAVLDAAGETSAHLYGMSLGGMIAQELALRHPERVRNLVLGATTPGGQEHELADKATRAFFDRRSEMSAEEAAWAAIPFSYGRATRERHADRIGEDVAQRLRFPPTSTGYKAQFAAAWRFDATTRLGRLQLPTLVLHGTEDRVMPVSNGRRLAAAIPGARLHLLEGAGHVYMTDDREADAEVLRFLTQSE
jgi:pimeloyl-ACP methyl ester carboxylesterase